MTFNVTLSRAADLTAEERANRARRAREALSSMGWAFDELISQETRALLDTSPHDTPAREQAYRTVRAAADLKGHLAQIIDTQEAEEKVNERRNRDD